MSYGSDPIKLASFLKKLAKDEKELKKLIKNAEDAFSSELDGKKTYRSMIEFLEKLTIENSNKSG